MQPIIKEAQEMKGRCVPGHFIKAITRFSVSIQHGAKKHTGPLKAPSHAACTVSIHPVLPPPAAGVDDWNIPGAPHARLRSSQTL